MDQRQKWRRYWHLAAYLGAAVCTLFIWSNSLAPAAQSAAQSLWVLERFDALLEWVGLPGDFGHGLLRKLAHMWEFALLGALWEAALATGRMRGKSWYCVQCACGFCLLTAMADETIQAFVPGRSSQVTDVWIDFGGACLGILAVFALFRLLGRRKSRAGSI